MQARYQRNIPALSAQECTLMRSKKVFVAGCGGLGGYVIEMLARLGVGHLVICDGDTFDETNLNRQLLATEVNIGASKVAEAIKRVKEINSVVDVKAYDEKLTNQSGRKIICGCDLVIDALDSPRDKVLLEYLCEELDITLVHGAISGWFGQVAVVFPGDQTLYNFYEEQEDKEDAYGNPAFTPALVASLQVSEATKLLLNTGDHMAGYMKLIDLYYNETEIIEV